MLNERLLDWSTAIVRDPYNGTVFDVRGRLSAGLRNPTALALGAILIVSLALRLFNLNWDQGLYLHPDERFIADVSTSRIV
ncbi:MAG: hypothetical protein IT334_11785, partial [Thermomicrobiales bacterium]|nr:hypothetical protein [Thermomicrobiales bacterium]